MQQVGGTEAAKSWPELETAPGNHLARLRSVCAVDETGRTVDMVDVRRPVGIEIGFTVIEHGPPVIPKIKLLDARGDVAFNAMDTHERWHAPAQPGDYVATAWIPGNLLNEGRISVDIGVCSLASPKLHHHVNEKEVVSFTVHDPAEGDSARGLFVGQWRGVVRPLLEWTCERA
jgi:lipopolysaccharide transport system ATP-binding protein